MCAHSQTRIECPSCGQRYSLELGPEPVDITCQNCGAQFMAGPVADEAPLIPSFPPVPQGPPTPSAMKYYYIAADNQAVGPVDAAQLQELFRQGHITGESGIAVEGGSQWTPFRQMQFQPQPAVAPVSSSIPASYAVHPAENPAQSPKKVTLAAWLMIGATCLVALIPGIGFLTWIIAGPILLVTFILGILALNKGATTQGIMILLASLVAAPLFLFIAPFMTTALAVGGGAAAVASSEAAAASQVENESEDSAAAIQTTEKPDLLPTPKKPQISTIAPAPGRNKKGSAQVGDKVPLNGLEIEITGLDQRRTLGGDFIGSKVAKGGVYLVVDWSYKNATRKPMSAFSSPDLTLLSPDGTEYEEDLGATATRATEVELDEKIFSNLNPGITVQSASVFEVAEDLLAEDGWRIQIEFDDGKTYFAVNGAAPKGGSSSGASLPEDSRNSGGNEEALAAAKKARMENELALQQAVEARNSKEKLAELKGELATVNAKIESERARYQAGLDTINRLTNFKKTPVREGSQAYYRCLEASKVIKEVESGAADLKGKKAKLEATIKELEK